MAVETVLNSPEAARQHAVGTSVLQQFFTRLRASSQAVLFLDYDGTLAPFHVDRNRAIPYAGVRSAIDRIMAAGHTHVIVISGRYSKELKPLLGLAQPVEIWGSHGWEHVWPDGRYEVAEPPTHALRGLAEADSWDEDITALGGTLEQKPGCLAVHWRGRSPQQVDAIRAHVLENWALLGRESGLELHEFDGGLELRVPGRHKGLAVDTVLREYGLAPDTAIAYLGDDLTDEDAFRALDGRGLRVLVRTESRPSAADVRLTPPAELVEFLNRWAGIDEQRRTE